MEAKTRSFSTVSEDAIGAYQEDGVVCLRGMIADEWLDLARKGIDQNLQYPGRFFRDHTPADSLGRYVFEYWSWPDTPEIKKIVLHSPLAQIAGELIQAQQVNMVMDNWFMREAGASNGAPWHHDEPYFDFEGTLCVVWIPLDPAPMTDGLNFVRGSHNWGELYIAPEFSKNVPFTCEGSAYKPVPDIDADPSAYEFLSWNVNVGDCLVFDFRTLHCVMSKSEAAKQSQRRLTLRFGAEDTIFSPRGKWTEETSEYLINQGQSPGTAIDCELMPRVWEKMP